MEAHERFFATACCVCVLVAVAFGFADAWAISLLTLSPYDFKLHPVTTLIVISLTFFSTIQFYRIRARREGEMDGLPAANRNCLIGGSVAALIMFGLYAPGAGTVAHEILTIAVFVAALWAAQWLIYWRRGIPESRGLNKVLLEATEFGLLILALVYYYEVLHGWEFFVSGLTR